MLFKKVIFTLFFIFIFQVNKRKKLNIKYKKIKNIKKYNKICFKKKYFNAINCI